MGSMGVGVPASAIDASHSCQSREQSKSGAVRLFAPRSCAHTGLFGQSGLQQCFIQVVRQLGSVGSDRGKCICHGIVCVVEFGLGVIGIGFQFHGLGGSVIDTWHVELQPRCRQQGVLVVDDARFFMRSQVRVLAGDEDIWDVFGFIRYGISIFERVSGLGVLVLRRYRCRIVILADVVVLGW